MARSRVNGELGTRTASEVVVIVSRIGPQSRFQRIAPGFWEYFKYIDSDETAMCIREIVYDAKFKHAS